MPIAGNAPEGCLISRRPQWNERLHRASNPCPRHRPLKAPPGENLPTSWRPNATKRKDRLRPEERAMSNRRSEDRRVLTAAEREARKVFRDADAKVPVSEYERAQQAFHANRERLKAERLAREAASTKRGAAVRRSKPGNAPKAQRRRRSGYQENREVPAARLGEAEIGSGGAGQVTLRLSSARAGTTDGLLASGTRAAFGRLPALRSRP